MSKLHRAKAAIASSQASRRLKRSSLLVSAAVAAIMLANPARAQLASNALPTGGDVVAGSATIGTPTPSSMTINQNSDRAVINWNTFDIGSGASVTFVQPSSTSIAVNRVISGAAPSEIAGQLNANGRVAILNPNGVLFSGTANVNVGSLIASTGDIDQTAFMSGGNMNITGATGGEIVVNGNINITAGNLGLAAFVAPTVRNSGVITATAGRVQLGGGTAFTLDLAGDGLLSIGVPASSALVENNGQVFAEGGRIQMSAKSAGAVVDNLVNTGTLSVDSATIDNGTIVLEAVGGSANLRGTVAANDRASISQNILIRSDQAVNISGNLNGASGTVNITAPHIYGTGKVSTATALKLNLSNNGTDTTGLGNYINDALGVIGTTGFGTTIRLGAGVYRSGVRIDASDVTIDGQGVARIGWTSGIENAIDVWGDYVTIKNLEISGPATSGYTSYAWGSTVSRGIFVNRYADNVQLLNNNIHDIRTGIIVDGRNVNTYLLNNIIDNTKSAISIQYTDGSNVTMTGNHASTYGNEWGINLHLNGILQADGVTILPSQGSLGANTPLAEQQRLLALRAANGGMEVQNQAWSASNRTAVYVSTTGSDSNQGSRLGTLASVQAGVNAVVTGGTVNVADGTYNLSNTLFIQKSLTLLGASEAGTIFNASALGVYGMRVHADDVTVSNFTLLAPSAVSSSTYGLKVEVGAGDANGNARIDNFAIRNVSISGSRKTGLDLNSVIGATIDNVNVTGAIAGNGISITDSANVTVRNTTTSGNAWGGLALYQANGATGSTQQLTGITIEGSNAFSEANGLYLQDSSAINDPGTLSIAGFDYIVRNTGHRGDGSQFTYFQTSLANASSFALALAAPTTGSIEGWSGTGGSNIFTVVNGLGIGAAVRDARANATINVGAGSYAENVVVNKTGISLLGAGRDVTTINGISGVGALGTVTLAAGSSNTTLSGFTINGIENGNPGSETAAVYLQQTNTGSRITGNRIVAAGDLGLVSEWGYAITGLVVDGNIITGKTYVGAAPATGDQFTVPNVSRQLVALGGGGVGGGISFTNNLVNGDSGLNTGVTIDSAGSTITGNSFATTTGGFGAMLRVRGAGATIAGNAFDMAGVAYTANGLYISDAALGTASFANLLAANTLAGAGAWSNSSATGYHSFSRNIQAAVNEAAPGAIVTIRPGDYVEGVTGVGYYGDAGAQSFGLYLYKDNITLRGVDTAGNAITDADDVAAFVTARYQAGFGAQHFISGNGVTIEGLGFKPAAAGDNKTVEVIGNAFILRNSVIDNSGNQTAANLYIDDFNDPARTRLESFTITGNKFLGGTYASAMVVVAGGAGRTTDASNRIFANNSLTSSLAGMRGFQIQGYMPNTPWQQLYAGAVTVTGNSFDVDIPVRTVGLLSSAFAWDDVFRNNGNRFVRGGVLTYAGSGTTARATTTAGGDPDIRITSTIDASLARAQSGDTIRILDGTYVLGGQLSLTTSVSLIGQSQAGTILDGRNVSNGGGLGTILVAADNTSLSNFTLLGSTLSGGNYGIKVQPNPLGYAPSQRISNVTISDVTVKGSRRAELDINGATGVTITNFTAEGQGTDGAGVQITDSANVTLTGVHTLGNNWGGVALYQTNRAGGYDGQTTNININAAQNSFEEANGLFSQLESTTQGFGQLNLTGYGYAVRNTGHRANGGQFTFFRTSLTDATAFALALGAPTTGSIEGYTGTAFSNVFSVVQGLGIDSAVRDARSGGTINIADGTYTLASTLLIDKSLSLFGASESGTILDASALTVYGMRVHADNVALSGFSLLAPSAASSSTYGIKVEVGAGDSNGNARIDNFAIRNVSISGSRKTGLDLNAVIGATIDNINVTGAIAGNGISITDSANVTVRNTTTSGNAWGGLALYQANSPTGSTQQLTGITVEGNNSFGEANGLYLQDSSAINDPGTLSIAGFDHIVRNTAFRADGNQFTFFRTSLSDATGYALSLATPTSSSIEGWAGSAGTNAFTVVDGLSIAAAARDVRTNGTINVGAGTYRSGTVLGTNGVSLIGASGAKIDASHDGDNGVTIAADGVTVSGFEIFGPADQSYVTYAWPTITRGIVVANGADNVTVTGNTITGVRNGILIDGRNLNASLTGNLIDNTKSAISVQYTNGSNLNIAGNSEGAFGNEWGIIAHLNGIWDGTSITASGGALGPNTPLSEQQRLLTLAAANGGMAVYNQAYSAANRTRAYVTTTGVAGAQGSQRTLLNLQGGLNAVVAGGTVHIGAGTYGESVTLDALRVLDIAGPITVNSLSFGAGAAGTNIGTDVTATGALGFATGPVLTGDTVLRGNTVSLGAITSAYGLTLSGTTSVSIGLADLASLTVSGGNIVTAGATTSGAQSYTGATTLAGTYTTGGAAFTIDGAASLAALTSITTAGGNVGLGGVSGANQLGVDAGTGSVTIGASSLGSLGVTGATILTRDIVTTGGQSYTGATTLAGSYATGGSFTVTGATLVSANTSLTSAGNVTFGTIGGAGALTVDAGTASLSFGAINGLSGLTASGATITTSGALVNGAQHYTGATTLAGLYNSFGGAFTVNGAATLAGAVDVVTAGGNASFGTVGGTGSLGVVATSGEITLGAVSGIASFSLSGANIVTAGASTSGEQRFSGATTLAGTYTTSGGAFVVAGPASLAGTTSVATSGGNAFLGTLNGAGNGLAVNAGNGSVTLGSATGLATLSATGTTISSAGAATSGAQSYLGATTLNGSYSAGGDFTVNGASTLASDTSVTAGGNAGFGTVSGAHGLTVDATGGVTLGATSGLTSLTATGATIATSGASTSGTQRYTGPTTLNGAYAAGGAFVIDGAATLASDTTILTSGGDALLGTVGGTGQALSLDAGTGTITLGTASGLRTLSATGATITTAGAATNGAQSYTGATALGGTYTTGGAAFTVNGAAQLAAPVYISTAGGDVGLGGGVSGAGNLGIDAVAGTVTLGTLNIGSLGVIGGSILTGGITTTGNQAFIGAITLDGSYAAGGSFTVNGATTIAGTTGLTTGGSAGFGTIGGAGALTIDAGANAVTLGAVNGLASLSVTGATIATSGASTAGAQRYTGATTLSGGYVTNGGAFAVNGATTTLTSVSVTTAGGNAGFGAIGGTSQALSVDAGTGSVTLGAVSGLGTLSATGATITTAGAFTNGAQSYTGATTLAGSYATGNANFTVNGATTLAGTTAVNTGGAISFGTINGAGNALAVTGGVGGVTLGAATGLGSLSASGALITTAGVITSGAQAYNGTLRLSGTYTAGGAFSAIGTTILTGDSSVATTNANATLGAIGGGHALTVTTGTGTASLGTVTGLTSLSLTGRGILTNGASTAGAQSYTGATLLRGNYATNGGAFTVTGTSTLGIGAPVNVTTQGGDASFRAIVGPNSGLNLNTGTGNATLGPVNGITALTVTGATITTSGASTVAGQTYIGRTSFTGSYTASDFSVLGDAILAGSTVLNTNIDGSIAMGSVIGNGSTSFAANAGSDGTVLVRSVIGVTDLSLTGRVVNNYGAVTSGAQNYNGLISLAGDHSAGGDITVNGAADLAEDTNVTAGGNVSFGGAITGAQALTVSAGGNVTLGAVSGLTALSASGATIVTAGASTSGAQSYTGDTVLNGSYDAASFSAGATTLAGATSVTTSGAATLGTIAGGGNALAVNGGSISLGAASGLASLAVTGTTIATSGVSSTGAQSYNGATSLNGAYSTAGGAFTVNGAATTVNAVSVATAGGTASFGAVGGGGGLAVNAGTGNVTLGAVSGIASLAVTGANIATAGASTAGAQAYTGSTSLNGLYASVGGFTVSGATTLAGTTTIATQNGNVVLGATSGLNALVVNAGTGNVVLGAASGLASLSVTGGTIATAGASTSGAQSYTGATLLGGAYNAGSFAVNGGTSLSGATTVATTGGNVSLGSVSGSANFGVNAGTGTVSIGVVTGLAGLTLSGATIATNGVSTVGSQSYTGATSLNGAYTTAGAAFTVTGATNLAGTTSVATANGAISLGTIDAAVAGSQALSLNAGTGAVALGNLGATRRLGATSVNAGSTVLGGTSYAANSLAFTGATVRLTQGSTVFNTTLPGGAGGAISIQPALVGTVNSQQNVTFTAGNGQTASSGNVTIGNAGSDAIRLGTMTVTGHDFAGATVKLAGTFTSLLSGSQAFSADTLDTLGNVNVQVAGNESGPIRAGGSVTINAGGSGSGSIIAGGPVNLGYGSSVSRAITAQSSVSVTSGGSITGPITAAGAVDLTTTTGAISSAVTSGGTALLRSQTGAISSTVTGTGGVSAYTNGNLTGSYTSPGAITLTSLRPINVQVNGAVVTVTAPSGTVTGVFGEIHTNNTGTLIVNDQPVIGTGTADARQILIDRFVIPAGGTVSANGEIQLPTGLALGLIAPAGDGKSSQRPPVVVNSVSRLGELLRVGYTAIIIQLDDSNLDVEEELAGQ